MKNIIKILSVGFLLGSALSVSAEGIEPKKVADMIHDALEANRIVYAEKIVNRLMNEEEVIDANEHWKQEQALLLPAQFFREGADIVREKSRSGVSYSLLSLWPVNAKNNAKSDVEKAGLKFISDNPGKNFYGDEVVAGKRYFTAIYPDIASSGACVTCHNNHKDSPKKDFKLNQIMGGMLIRIPTE